MASLSVRRLEIRNFRGVEQSVLEFSDTNILVGNNGSGKTATLAAIARLLPAMRKESRLFLDADFRMDEDWTAQTITLSYQLEIDGQLIDIEVTGDRKNSGASRSHLNDQLPSTVKYTISDEEKLAEWLEGSAKPSQRIIRCGWQGGRIAPIYLEQGSANHAATSEREEMGHFDSLRARLVELKTESKIGRTVRKDYPELEENILSTTNALLGEERFSKFALGHGKEVMLGTCDGNMVPFTEVCGGEQSIIHLAMALEQEARQENQIVLLEEPETTLHPLIQANFVKVIKNKIPHAQLFVTTHSPYVFQDHIADTNVLVATQDVGEKTFQRYDPDNWLLGYPSFAEINYRAYQVYTTDFHNQLYGALQARGGFRYTNQIDTFLVGCGIAERDCTRIRDTNSNEELVTLCTYVRHSIHHPENRLNPDFTKEELEKSTQLLINALQLVYTTGPS